MKTYSRIFIAVAVLLATLACSRFDDLQERVDRIESRVTALEKVAEAVNDNIKALQAIASGQAINNVEEKDGTYVPHAFKRNETHTSAGKCRNGQGSDCLNRQGWLLDG